jgi:hypothetical protein
MWTARLVPLYGSVRQTLGRITISDPHQMKLRIKARPVPRRLLAQDKKAEFTMHWIQTRVLNFGVHK